MKVRFHTATSDGACTVCGRAYAAGDRIVRGGGRAAHGPCMAWHVRARRNRLNQALEQIKAEFALTQLTRPPVPETREVVGRFRGEPVYLQEDGRTARAKRNADCGMRNADSARREEPRPGPVRNPQSEIRDPQSTDPQSTDREVD